MRPGTGPPGFCAIDHLLQTLLRCNDSTNNAYKELGLRYHSLPLVYRQDVIDNVPKEACKAFLLTGDGQPSSMMLRLAELDNSVSAVKVAIRDRDFEAALALIESSQGIADDLDDQVASLRICVDIHFAVKARHEAAGIIAFGGPEHGVEKVAGLAHGWARQVKDTKAALLLGTINDVDTLAFTVGLPGVVILDGPTEVWVDRCDPRQEAARARAAAEQKDEVEMQREELSKAELELRWIVGPLAAVKSM